MLYYKKRKKFSETKIEKLDIGEKNLTQIMKFFHSKDNFT
jgi:hypothetical protein